MTELEGQELGTIARLSVVSTSEQVKSYVDSKIIGSGFIKKSGDSNIGTLQLSGDLSANSLKSLNATFGYNNQSELCSIAEGSTNHAISPFSHAEGDGNSYAGSKSFTIRTISTDKKTITLDTDISQIQLSDELIVQNSGASDLKKITSIDVATKTIVLDSIVGTSTKAGSYVMVMHKPWLGTVTRGDGAHVEGYQNMAFEDAHAENIMNAAYGKYSHCHGNANKAGWMATAFGTGNSALGNGSIALGGASATNNQYAICDTNAIVKGTNSFAWSGNGKYEVTKNGTFNINPIGGSKGFYIGSKTLPDIIHEIVDGRNVNDEKARIIKLDVDGETLLTTIQASKIVNDYISEFKSEYDDAKDEYKDVKKSSDEIKDEAEHLYVLTTEENDEYNYFQIVVAQIDGTNSYSWKKITEKAKVSYIKKEGDTGIGPLSLNSTLQVGSNNVVGSNCSVAEGFCNEIGSIGYNMKSGNINTLTIELDVAEGEDVKFNVGDVLSFKFGRLSNISNKDASTITEINGNTITVDKFPGSATDTNLYDEDGNMCFDLGTKLVFCYANPVGNVGMGVANHIEGAFNSTKGNTSWAHAEGFKNVVIDNYAHAEGMATKANHSSHAEGRHTEATGQIAHSEGTYTVADGGTTHVAGQYAASSKLEGATEDVSITLHNNDYIAFVDNGQYNRKLVVVNPADVYDPTAGGKKAPFDLPKVPDGYKYAYKGSSVALTSLSASMSQDPRKRDSVVHHGSFVAKTIQCENQYDYNIDWVTKVTGITEESKELTYKILNEGKLTKYSTCYVWNGIGSQTFKERFYESHGSGTFNINPANGTKGFYIGDDPLFNILSSSQSNALSNITFDTSRATGIDYLADMLSTVISAFGGKII